MLFNVIESEFVAWFVCLFVWIVTWLIENDNENLSKNESPYLRHDKGRY